MSPDTSTTGTHAKFHGVILLCRSKKRKTAVKKTRYRGNPFGNPKHRKRAPGSTSASSNEGSEESGMRRF